MDLFFLLIDLLSSSTSSSISSSISSSTSSLITSFTFISNTLLDLISIILFFIDTCILQPNYSNLTEDILKSRVFQYENEKRDMMKWLEFELEKSRNKKIVLGHYPIISWQKFLLE